MTMGSSPHAATTPTTGLRPPSVERSLRFFREHDIWHLPSRNPPVGGCAQAAAQRRRLGGVGIPLCDELKSLLYAYVDARGRRNLALLHCRGHQHLDLAKVSAVLGAAPSPVSSNELRSRFGAEYGTVTPFLLADHPEVRQVLDDSVLARFFAPYTIMTNCGDLEHAVEFRARDLFNSLPRTVVADIVADEHKRVPSCTLGIVTGNSPESGMLLWEKINGLIRDDSRVPFRGDVSLPRTLIDSVPDMGASMELAARERDVRPVVVNAVRGLCEAGATVIGVACNTMQHFTPQIRATCAEYSARFVSLAEETRRCLEREQIRKLDFLGIPPVTDLDGWSDFGRALRDIDVHLPAPQDLEAITELAFRAKREVVSPATVTRLRDVIRRSTRTDTVVVALTEMSILLSRANSRPRSGKRFIDTLDILAAMMAEAYLEDRIATGGT